MSGPVRVGPMSDTRFHIIVTSVDAITKHTARREFKHCLTGDGGDMLILSVKNLRKTCRSHFSMGIENFSIKCILRARIGGDI